MSDPAVTQPTVRGIAATDDEAVLELAIPPELLWFRGHFPGLPVVPGVVLLDWALEFGRQTLGTPAVARDIAQVKFRRLLRPGAAVRLLLQRRRGGAALHFRYESEGVVAASGRFDFPS